MDEIQQQTVQIKQYALDLGFHLVGVASAKVDDHNNQQQLKQWLRAGFHAEMAWMHNPKRQNIQKCLPGVQSVICVALNYYTPHSHSQDPTHGKISRYGWGRDYHRVLGKRLKSLCHYLGEFFPHDRHRFYVDTGPVQDKVWAERAGIGWIAKNSNVITRQYGSWVFLGEVLTTLRLSPDKPHMKHCGSCTRCIDACPTEAIAAPFTVDANRCIAYHTIENRAESLPHSIASNLNNWIAGCDICQDVCPWNQRFAQPTNIDDFQPYSGHLEPELNAIAQLSDETWDRQLTGSALRRIKPAMWQRNAQTNLAHNKKPPQVEQ